VIAAAVVFALGAASFYAVAATLQYRAAHQERQHATLDPRLLIRLLARPVWLLGGLADLAGATLHAVALGFGPLALVQPLLVSGLVLAVPLEAAIDRRRPERRQLIAVVFSAAGLGTFVAVVSPEPGVAVPSNGWMLGLGLLIVGAVAACISLALRARRAARATLLGISAGALYALAAALAKACVHTIDVSGLGVFADPHFYALVVVGISAMVLNQNAFQAGNLAGPLTGIALTDPLVSLVIGAFAFHEHLSLQGLDGVVAVGAALVMGRGVWLVSSNRSSRLARIRR
jgi:hypothetical protein